LLWIIVPVIQILGIYSLFYFLLNAYLALWFLNFELFDHFLYNSRKIAILANAIKTKADTIAIRRNKQIWRLANTGSNDIIDSLTSIPLNLLYTLLITALTSYFLQKLIIYFTLPWLYETRSVLRKCEKKEFAQATNNNDYLLRDPCRCS